MKLIYQYTVLFRDMRFCLRYLSGVTERRRRERERVREKRERKRWRWRIIEASLTAPALTGNQEVCPDIIILYCHK